MSEMKDHEGDCSIYSSMLNGGPEDGICTCGYGYKYSRANEGDRDKMFSEERLEFIRDGCNPAIDEYVEELKLIAEENEWAKLTENIRKV